MANVKISALDEATSMATGDLLLSTEVGSPASKKITLDNFNRQLVLSKLSSKAAIDLTYTSPDTSVVNVGSDISSFAMIANLNDSALDATTNFTLTPTSITYDTNIPNLTGISKSAVFNGTSSKYTINGPIYVTGTINRPLTVDCWVNFASLSGIQPIFTHYNGATEGDIRIHWTGDQINVYRFNGTSINCKYARYNWIPTLGTWYHIAVVWQSNGYCFIAVDGVGDNINPAGPDPGGTTGNTYAIGYLDDTADSFFSGRISNLCVRDNVAVWTSNFTKPTATYNTTAPTEILFTSQARTLVANTSFADMRTDLGAAASGAITSSGLTTTASRLIGHGTGAGTDLEEITAGSGLAWSGSTISVDTGTTANKVLQLNGSAQIPAVDGSLISYSATKAVFAGQNKFIVNTSNYPTDAFDKYLWHFTDNLTDSITGITTTGYEISAGDYAAVTNFDKALTLNGSSKYVKATAPLTITTNDFSISLRVYFAALAAEQYVFCYRHGADYSEVMMEVTAAGKLATALHNGSQNWIESANGVITTGNWYTILVNRVGSAVTVYVNGTSVATGTVAGSLSQTGDLWLGRRLDAGTPWYVSGMIDEFKVRIGASQASVVSPIAPWGIATVTENSIEDVGLELLANESFADMRTDLGAAASGAIASSGLTTTASRLTGHGTGAGTALEEITAGSGLAWSGSTISVTPTPGLYRNKWISAPEFIPRTTNGATYGEIEYVSNYVQLPYFDFDAVTSQGIQVPIVMPDEWDRSTIKIKHYWTNGEASGGANDVIWRTRGKFLAHSDAIDSAWGDPVGVTSTFTTDGDFVLSPVSAAITIGGSGTLAAGNLIILEVYRYMTGNTYTKKARYLGCFIQYNELTTSPALWTTP